MDRAVDTDSHMVATTKLGVASFVDDQQFFAAFVHDLDVKKGLRAKGLDNADLAGNALAVRDERQMFWANTETEGRAVDRRGSGCHFGGEVDHHAPKLELPTGAIDVEQVHCW